MILTTSLFRPVPSSSRAHDHDSDNKQGSDSHVEFDQQSTTVRYLDAGYCLWGLRLLDNGRRRESRSRIYWLGRANRSCFPKNVVMRPASADDLPHLNDVRQAAFAPVFASFRSILAEDI